MAEEEIVMVVVRKNLGLGGEREVVVTAREEWAIRRWQRHDTDLVQNMLRFSKV